MRHSIRNSLLLATLLLGGCVQAEMYRCTSTSGAVTFSDRRCTSDRQDTVDMKYKYDKVESLDSPVKPVGVENRLLSPPPAAQKPDLPVRVQEGPSADKLAELCVDAYRPHLAYPKGVLIRNRALEKSLSEMLITVNVRTITNPATPSRIAPIFLNEKFICVTDFGSGLHQRSTSFYVERHKRGERL